MKVCAPQTTTSYTIKGDLSHATKPMRILEIGCGSGVISLLLAQRYKHALIDSIDIDGDAIKQILANIESCPHPSWVNRIRVFHCPVQQFVPPSFWQVAQDTTNPDSDITNETDEADTTGNKILNNLNSHFIPPSQEEGLYNSDQYDLIICAPPYFKSDQSVNMIAQMNSKRRIARHTHTLTMDELIDRFVDIWLLLSKAAVGSILIFGQSLKRLLKADTGRFKTIFSLPYPADEFDKIAPTKGVDCLERVHVRDSPNDKIIRYPYHMKGVAAAHATKLTSTSGNCGECNSSHVAQ